MKLSRLQRIIPVLVLICSLPILVQAQALQQVSLQMQWKHQFEYAGFYAAIAQGFYQDEGLQLELREIAPGMDVQQEVTSGRANYGINYSSLIADYLSGQPVVMLANIFKHSALVIISQKELSLPSDLVGKNVMGSDVELKNSGITMMFNRFDMHIDDINIIEPTQTVDAFVERRIDAMTAFITNQPFLLNRKQVRYNILNPSSYGSQFYDVNVFTSRHEADHYPERTAAFLRATLKGWQYALSHKEEIIQLILQRYNTQHKTKDALEYEAEIVSSLILPNIYKIGSIDCRVIKEMADNFIQAGLAPENSDIQLRRFLFHKSCAQPVETVLTAAEQQFLIKKGEIKLCIDPNWMPFEKLKNGKHIGMSADYMRLIEDELQIPIMLVPTENWMESVEFAKARKCDIWSLAMATPERKKYMSFTKPYLVIPLVIATKNDKFFIVDLNEVKQQKIGLVKGYAFTEILKADYPDHNWVEVDTIADGLQQVADGEIYGMIDNLTTIAYQMQKKYIGTLKIAGRLNKNWELGIGVRNDEPLLRDILEKAIERIDEKTRQNILNQWMSISYELPKDYSILWEISAVILLIFMLLLYRYRVISHYNNDLQKLNQKLEVISITDPLTELYNRRYLDKTIQSSLNLAKRYRTPFSVVLLDIDNFKLINDTNGHDVGDKVLQQIADILVKNSRKNDLAGRWGGEEFLIICAQSHLSGAVKLAEHLCFTINHENFSLKWKISASFGVTEYKENDTANSIFKRVDSALYQAKKQGKNQVIAE